MRGVRTFGARVFGHSALLAAALASVACTGGESPNCAATEPGCEETPPPAPPSASVSQLARLTHTQWKNTVRDLLGSDSLPDLSRTFRNDPNQQGYLFDSDVESLVVDEALWQAYQAAASEVASSVVADSALLARLTPPDVPPESLGRAFIEAFGERVHRRPLTDAQLDEYLAVYSSGPGVFPELEPFVAGVRLLLQAFLQSPFFLYRVEGGGEPPSGDALDGYEVGARLSYTLWDTMPDDALLAAAKAGELASPAAVAEHARRLLGSDRAKPVIRRMHSLLLDVGRYRGILRYPEEALPAMAETEHRLFVDHVLFDRRGTLRDLLTSTETFANATLADLYGVEGEFGDDFERVELDPTERSGFLTQVGFLASNANTGVPDPIHRGVFVARRLACIDVPMPPDNIPPLPAAAGRTNRETVTAHTETPGTVCAGCHAGVINPFGFPFEYYDGLGRYRTEDNALPVDGTARPVLSGAPVVTNAVELAKALAESPEVHACYAKHLLEFTFGRLSTASDQELIDQTAARSMADDAAVQDLIIELVSSPKFLARRAEESQ